jgi:hypothetical protein
MTHAAGSDIARVDLEFSCPTGSQAGANGTALGQRISIGYQVTDADGATLEKLLVAAAQPVATKLMVMMTTTARTATETETHTGGVTVIARTGTGTGTMTRTMLLLLLLLLLVMIVMVGIAMAIEMLRRQQQPIGRGIPPRRNLAQADVGQLGGRDGHGVQVATV